MWEIDKSFTFEAGHRVHSQVLNRPQLSGDTHCKCRHLHGHSYTVKVFLRSNQLTPEGFVLDFKELEFCKKFLDDVLDHKFIIDVHDPNFEKITGQLPLVARNEILGADFVTFPMIYPEEVDEIDEHLHSFVIVNFVPTSENICKWLHGIFQSKLQGIAEISAIELWETAKSHCRYQPA